MVKKRAASAKPGTIDEYLSRLPDDKRSALQKLREDIRAAVPDAEECISYDMPGMRLAGRLLVSFGATAKHCAFYAGAYPIETHQEALRDYDIAKGTIRFPAARPLPSALVRALVETRVAQR